MDAEAVVVTAVGVGNETGAVAMAVSGFGFPMSAPELICTVGATMLAKQIIIILRIKSYNKKKHAKTTHLSQP